VPSSSPWWAPTYGPPTHTWQLDEMGGVGQKDAQISPSGPSVSLSFAGPTGMSVRLGVMVFVGLRHQRGLLVSASAIRHAGRRRWGGFLTRLTCSPCCGRSFFSARKNPSCGPTNTQLVDASPRESYVILLPAGADSSAWVCYPRIVTDTLRASIEACATRANRVWPGCCLSGERADPQTPAGR